VIKVLQELYQTPLYKSAKISIEPNWQDFVELTNTNETIELEEYIWCKFRNKKTKHIWRSSWWRLHMHISAKYFKSWTCYWQQWQIANNSS